MPTLAALTRPVGFLEDDVKALLAGDRAVKDISGFFVFSLTAQGHEYWWGVRESGNLTAKARAHLEAMLELPSAPAAADE